MSILKSLSKPWQKPWVGDLILPAAQARNKDGPKLSISVARELGTQVEDHIHGC